MVDREKHFAEWLKRNEAHVCATCGRNSDNYLAGTECPIEEHYSLPKDGYCHLWEEKNMKINKELLKTKIIVHDDGDQKLYFTEWIKYRPDLPLELKEMFDKAGMNEGDSMPIYCNDPDEALRFNDPGMALQVMKKQQELYPEWKEQLYSIPWISRHGKNAEERLLNAMFRESPEEPLDGVEEGKGR